MKKRISVILCTLLVCLMPLQGAAVQAANTPTIACENVTCYPGEQITVDVFVSNNPGFSYLELTPKYSQELTLAKVTNGSLISDFTKGKQYVWVSDEDVTQNGLLMTFTFQVAETVAPGEYTVDFVVRTCGNYNEEPVGFATQKGIITVNEKPVSSVITGDLDGDESISNKDVEYLLWYTLFPEEFSINQDADFDGDGYVDNKDVEYLLWHTLFPEDYPLTR